MKVSKQYADTFLTHGLFGALPNPSNSGKGKNGNYKRSYNKTRKGKSD